MDTSEIYRAALKEYKETDPEEEILLWQEYLATYPNTAFRKQIETRLEDLEVKLYDQADKDFEVEKKQKEKENLILLNHNC